jgi:uncharacterized protein YxjI
MINEIQRPLASIEPKWQIRQMDKQIITIEKRTLRMRLFLQSRYAALRQSVVALA